MSKEFQDLHRMLLGNKLSVKEELEIITRIHDLEKKLPPVTIFEIKIRILDEYKTMESQESNDIGLTDHEIAEKKKKIIEELKHLDIDIKKIREERDKLNRQTSTLYEEAKQLKEIRDDYSRKTKYHKETRNDLQQGRSVVDLNKDHNYHHEEVLRNFELSDRYHEMTNKKYNEAKESKNKANNKHHEYNKLKKRREKLNKKLKKL